MTPVRTLIVDDEVLARRRIARLLAGRADVAVVGEARNGREALERIRSARPDLVFLDVQMPDLDGFEVLAALDELPLVVFVTAWDQYALRAFDVHALDYLLKPFDDDRFEAALTRAVERIRRERLLPQGERTLAALAEIRRDLPRRLLLKDGGRLVLVDPGEIDWIGAAGVYVELHLDGRTHLMRDSLAGMAARLPVGQFQRIHRSAIVNLERIRALHPRDHGEYGVELRDGTLLKASRTHAAALVRALETLG